MYAKIKQHETVVTKYGRRLVEEGVYSQAEVDAAAANYRKVLDDAFEAANNFKPNKADWLDGKWSGLEKKNADDFVRGDTGISKKMLQQLGTRLTQVPDGFNLHRALVRQLKAKKQMFETGKPSTGQRPRRWPSVRSCWKAIRCVCRARQERGTFSQRHSVWIDQETERRLNRSNILPTIRLRLRWSIQCCRKKRFWV